ncbi:MAG: cytidine deaminase [Oscillospiraceae bacterium]|nr:cytidine deaminase [Oscillospiraceae bacterium]
MDWSGLIEQAFEGLQHAYAPCSGFRVGAALLGRSGTVYTGCNVESCAYTPTCCAERTALVKAVSEGERAFLALAVVSDEGADGDYTSPCGVCRQMLFEFCGGEMPVILAKSKEDYRVTTLGTLLPMGFGPAKLGKEGPVCE